jgi:transcription elongation factor Elf1
MPSKDPEKNKLYRRTWYYKNKERARNKTNERKLKIRRWLQELKSTLQCKGCGENRIACLDFHHRNPTEKDMSIVKAVENAWSIQRILKEIEKCEVLCSNCHRYLHWLEKQGRSIPAIISVSKTDEHGAAPCAFA